MSDIKIYLKEYGLKLLLCTGCSRLLRKLHFPRSVLFAYDRYKHKKVQAYLYKRYSSLVEKQEEKPQAVHRMIYVFWWQGEAGAPETVQMCIRSIRRNGGAEVIVLSKDNYDQYVDLPDYIVEKMQTGKMSLAHFSDVLRFNLLYKSGGLWLDATDFLTDPVPEEIFERPFYSNKTAFASTYGWQWTSFFIAAQKNDYLCGLMVDFYNQYWKENDTAITYLVLDCWLTVLYNHNQKVKEEIDGYSADNLNVFALTGVVGLPYSQDVFENAKKASYIHKLTYKEDYLESIDGKLTVWGYIKQHENPDACELESRILH